MIKLFDDRKEVAVLQPPYWPIHKGDVILFEEKHYEVKHIVHLFNALNVEDIRPAGELHLYCTSFPLL